MWPSALSGRLPIVALVGRYPANWLIGRGPILYRRSFSHCTMRYCALMRYYQPFPAAIPQYRAGCPRVTHPSATNLPEVHSKLISSLGPFDLHVLGTPPAFILSQDRTLESTLYLSRTRCTVPVHAPDAGGFMFVHSFLNSFSAQVQLTNLHLNYLGIFRVALLFICQGASPQTFVKSKYLRHILCRPFERRIRDNIIHQRRCQQLFLVF